MQMNLGNFPLYFYITKYTSIKQKPYLAFANNCLPKFWSWSEYHCGCFMGNVLNYFIPH